MNLSHSWFLDVQMDVQNVEAFEPNAELEWALRIFLIVNRLIDQQLILVYHTPFFALSS